MSVDVFSGINKQTAPKRKWYSLKYTRFKDIVVTEENFGYGSLLNMFVSNPKKNWIHWYNDKLIETFHTCRLTWCTCAKYTFGINDKDQVIKIIYSVIYATTKHSNVWAFSENFES